MKQTRTKDGYFTDFTDSDSPKSNHRESKRSMRNNKAEKAYRVHITRVFISSLCFSQLPFFAIFFQVVGQSHRSNLRLAAVF